MKHEGIISKAEAVAKISKRQYRLLSLPVFDEEKLKNSEEIVNGITCFKGVAYGKVFFTEEKAREHINLGEKVIFVTRYFRADKSGEEFIQLVDGVVTSGGMCSDLAIITKDKEKPCILIDRTKFNFNKEETSCILNDIKIIEGHTISIDATNGKIYNGIIKIIARTTAGNYGKIKEWMNNGKVMDRDKM